MQDTMTRASAVAFATGLAVSLTPLAHASDPELLITGETFGAFNPGGNQFAGGPYALVVPDLRGSIILFTVLGADGGNATTGGNGQCFNPGGQGATATIDAVIGDGEDELRPNQPIRFIVGKHGEDQERLMGTASESTGGGGGSAVVYLPGEKDGSQSRGWDLIAVAGGGGGAASVASLGICTSPNGDGKDAETIEDGGDGRGNDPAAGGDPTEEGAGVIDVSGGGGGTFSGPVQFVGYGDAGFTFDNNDDPIGGRGGDDLSGRGGYGFGGAGAAAGGGGGGGGYSGGGGGRNNRSGGGGGSFTNEDYAFSTDLVTVGSSGVRNGQISYAFTGQVHDERADALPILPAGTDSDLIFTLSGTTIAATVSPLNNVPEPGPDVWYTHTNTSDCEQFFRFDWPLSQNTQLVLIRPGASAPFERTAGPLNLSLDPGQSLELRIASQSDTFAIEVDFALGDFDNDGVCNSADICPGVDDLTLDPADDVDNDGIHDVCDQACEVDVFPDGEFTIEDWQVFALVAALGSPQERLQLDFDQSGVFDSFDYAIFFDYCP